MASKKHPLKAMHASQWGRERKRKVISWSQVTTTNQFSYLPYQQSLLAYNKQVNIELVTWLPTCNLQQPFTRSNKLRTAVIKREQKNVGPRPKSVDFEVNLNQSATLISVSPPGVAVRREHLSCSAAGLQRRGGCAGHKGKSTQRRQALTTCKRRI